MFLEKLILNFIIKFPFTLLRSIPNPFICFIKFGGIIFPLSCFILYVFPFKCFISNKNPHNASFKVISFLNNKFNP